MTLYGEFLDESHRRMHKWHQYFPAYEAHFARFQNRHVTLFEIGIGEGGSLQQWRRYLGPFAIIVGIDIYPRCKQVEEPQVHVRIGSQTDLAFLARVVAEFGAPDIVIDDGSHLQPHVNATFDLLYPHVAKNGVYLVEDLHAAYWPNHGGGLRAPSSFIETAKGFVDSMHADYIDGGLGRSPAGDRTTSIHFYDSVVVFEVGERRQMANTTTGNAALFSNEWAPPDHTVESYHQVVSNALNGLQVPGPAMETAAAPRMPDAEAELHALRTEVALLRRSTSWRLTAPFRAIMRLFRRR